MYSGNFQGFNQIEFSGSDFFDEGKEAFPTVKCNEMNKEFTGQEGAGVGQYILQLR